MLRRRRKAGDSHINTEGWMMSYADMATILLAMFIVLSTLGKDQSGVNLYNGTGSFRKALDSFGLPGFFPSSVQLMQLEYAAPHYSLEGPGASPGRGQSSGEGEADAPSRTIDGEQEQMQRFLQEIGRRFPVEKVPRTEGQTVVDFYDPLNKSAPYLAPNQRDVIAQSVPMLRRDNFRVFVVVWATTPAEKAWIRAGTQAQLVAEEIANIAQLDSKARARLIPLGQPWRYPDLQRPIMSLVIVKTDAATGKH